MTELTQAQLTPFEKMHAAEAKLGFEEVAFPGADQEEWPAPVPQLFSYPRSRAFRIRQNSTRTAWLLRPLGMTPGGINQPNEE